MDKEVKQPSKAKKAANIIINILLYLFLAICMAALVFTLAAKRDSDGAITIRGTALR